MLNQIHQ